jgi:hypothetical protein
MEIVTSVETKRTPAFFSFFLTAVILGVIGWAGLYVVIFYTLPTLGPRWLLFFLALLAATGTAIPIVYFLNRRFPSTPPADGSVIIRQSIWVGVYADLLIWLQLGRVLSLALAFFIAMGLIGIEFLLRLRERSRFQVEQDGHD